MLRLHFKDLEEEKRHKLEGHPHFHASRNASHHGERTCARSCDGVTEDSRRPPQRLTHGATHHHHLAGFGAVAGLPEAKLAGIVVLSSSPMLDAGVKLPQPCASSQEIPLLIVCTAGCDLLCNLFRATKMNEIRQY